MGSVEGQGGTVELIAQETQKMNPKAHLEATKGLLVAAKKLQEAGVENADEMVDWFEKEVARLEQEV